MADEGAFALGGEFGYSGGVGVRARYLWQPEDDNPSTFTEAHFVSALATLPLALGSGTLCPALGLESVIRSRPGDDREVWRVPVGAGIGWSHPVSESVTLRPFLFPQAVYVEGITIFELTEENMVVQTGDDDRVDARLDFGALVTSGSFYGSATVRVEASFEGEVGTGIRLERPLLLTAGFRL